MNRKNIRLRFVDGKAPLWRVLFKYASSPHLRIYSCSIKNPPTTMAAEILTRPVICLARNELACIRSARKSLFSPRRHLATSSYSTQASIPEFLLPAFATKRTVAPSFSYNFSPLHQSPATRMRPLQQRRNFSASAANRAVVVAANPRRDEDGNEMLIDITARAANVQAPHPASLSTSLLTSCLAFEGNYVERLQPEHCTSSDCRFRWLPRFSILYVSHKHVRPIARR